MDLSIKCGSHQLEKSHKILLMANKARVVLAVEGCRRFQVEMVVVVQAGGGRLVLVVEAVRIVIKGSEWWL